MNLTISFGAAFFWTLVLLMAGFVVGVCVMCLMANGKMADQTMRDLGVARDREQGGSLKIIRKDMTEYPTEDEMNREYERTNPRSIAQRRIEQSAEDHDAF